MDIKKAIEILELKNFTSIDELKVTFRNLAHQYHPDKNPENDGEKFRQAVQAYEFTLENISALFDYFGLKEASEDEVTAKIAVENLDDIFEDIFGFSKSGRILGYQKAQDINLELEDFLLGGTKTLKLVAYIKCDDCTGLGAQKPHLAKICSYCFGHGTIKLTGSEKPCPKCQGRGRKISHKCQRCDGFGRLKRFHRQQFELPVGIRPGQKYSLEGLDLTQNIKTEIFIKPNLSHHPIFKIENYNLLCEYHIDYRVLELPLKVHFNTPLGKVLVTIPTEAKMNDVIKVHGQGLYKNALKKQRGDLIVTLKPKKRSLIQKIFGGLFE
ncbi:hypothetical protein BVY03_05205 [bacterium K02(2017)]|nr:hypothetical protein BVY03_05205 [bacterium K02(2017)]